LLSAPGRVLLLGSIDSGKSTFASELVRKATERGIPAALVDADIGQSTVGPPTTVGLKLCAGMEDFARETIAEANAMGFVGALSPKGHVTALVNATAKMITRARDAGCRLVVVDTTGLVTGTLGQLLKFYKIEATGPDAVVAFKRGGELEPVLGIAQRFSPAEVYDVDAAPEEDSLSPFDRISNREGSFATYFAHGTSRWRVKPTVFMPTLPPDFELGRLDGLVVGMEDGKGACVGIGILEYEKTEDILRMISPVSEGVRGLRLGSVRIDLEGHAKGQITLRDLFQSE
jgi:polynucleotide 5'-hydroxyl-kinase GRC3/NOL9